jgi:hypothetical protein
VISNIMQFDCLLCDKSADADTLNAMSSFEIDIGVSCCVQSLQDSALLSKLEYGDLVVNEASYHAQCLAFLYEQAQAVENFNLPESANNLQLNGENLVMVSLSDNSRLAVAQVVV